MEVVEERASNNLCGYPLCDRPCEGLEKCVPVAGSRGVVGSGLQPWRQSGVS